MAVTGYKIYVTGNIAYIDEIVDSGSAFQYEGLAKNCLPRKKYTNSTEFSFSGFNGLDETKAFPFAQLKDGNGDAWADQATFEAWATSNLGKPSAGDSALIESRATIINRCPDNDFRNAHSSKLINGKIYLGTRADGVTAPVLKCYNNIDNLTDSDTITMTLAGTGVNGIENICYDEVNGKLYSTLSNTRKLLVVNNLDDITDYDIIDVAMTTGLLFGASSAIVTDGAHIYVATETTPAYFIKIATSDFSVAQEEEWVGGNMGAHSGTIDVSSGFAYFLNSGGTPPLLAKVDLTDLSYTTVEMPIGVYTDDCAFVPAFPLSYNAVVTVCENRNTGSKGGVLINVDSMDVDDVKTVDLLPGFGVFYVTDGITFQIYNVALAGFVERVDVEALSLALDTDADQKNLADVFTLRGFMPNEFMVNIDGSGNKRFFVTFWNNATAFGGDGKGALAEIRFDKVSPSTITKYEILKRFFND